MSLQLSRSLHTAILVSDLAQAERFYGQILGLQKVDRSLKYAGVWYQIGDHQLHLIVDATLPKALHNPAKWGRNPHLAIATPDIAAAEAHLEQNHCPIQKSASGRPALFVQDPDGNVIELTQVS